MANGADSGRAGGDATLLLIGPAQKEDGEIKPDRHPALFENSAPELAAILKMGSLTAISFGYLAADKDAMRTRDNYKGRLERAIQATIAGAACAAAAAVYGGVIKDQSWLPLSTDLLIMRVLVAAQVGFLLLSAIIVLRATDPATGVYREWRESRARAEHTRTELFLAVMKEASERTPPNPALVDQTLAYVRRFLWNSQVIYFRDRGEAHAQASAKRVKDRRILMQLTRAGMGAIVIVTAFSLIAAVVPVGPGDTGLIATMVNVFRGEVGVEAIVGGGGVLIAAVLAAGQAREAIHEDQANAKRYAETGALLRQHGGEAWDQPSEAYASAAAKAKAGQPKEARQWTQTVVDTLRRELAEWRTAQPSDIRLEPMADLYMEEARLPRA